MMTSTSDLPLVLCCSACDNLLIDPVELQPCGHVVCRSCVLEADAGAPGDARHICPVFDDDPEKVTIAAPPVFIQRELDAFMNCRTTAVLPSSGSSYDVCQRRNPPVLPLPDSSNNVSGHAVLPLPESSEDGSSDDEQLDITSATYRYYHTREQLSKLHKLATLTEAKLAKKCRKKRLTEVQSLLEFVSSETPAHVAEKLRQRAHEISSATYLWPEYTDADRARNWRLQRPFERFLLMTNKQIGVQLGKVSLENLSGMRAWVTTATPKRLLDKMEERYRKLCFQNDEKALKMNELLVQQRCTGQKMVFLRSQYTDADRMANLNSCEKLQELSQMTKEEVIGCVGKKNRQGLIGLLSWATTDTPRFVVDTIEARFVSISCRNTAFKASERQKRQQNKRPRMAEMMMGGEIGGAPQEESSKREVAASVTTTTRKRQVDIPKPPLESLLHPNETKARKVGQGQQYLAELCELPTAAAVMKATEQWTAKLVRARGWMTRSTPTHVVEAVEQRYKLILAGPYSSVLRRKGVLPGH